MLFLYGIPVHHFFIGIGIVVFVLLLRIFFKRFTLGSLLFLGIGIGLIADEFYLIATGNFTSDNLYWAGQNLTAILLIGGVSYGFLKILEWKKTKIANTSVFHNNPKHPHISVVVPALNEEKYLEKNLMTLMNQSYKNFEIIVVDNNSTDHTAQIAKKYGAIVISCHEKGVGAARQAGFLKAKGTIIATTDADNLLPEDWLTTISQRFEKDKKMVAYGGLFRLYSGPFSARIAVKYLGYSAFQVDKLFSGKWSLIAQNMAVRKDAFLQVGGFKKVQMGEDADLAQRLAAVGNVILDKNFLVYASGRRVRYGLWYGVWTYAPNALYRMFFKKQKFDRLKTVRAEQSILSELSVIPLLLSVIYLIFLFTSMNANLGNAQERLLEKTTSTISITKLRNLAKELQPTDTLQNFYEETRGYILQED